MRIRLTDPRNVSVTTIGFRRIILMIPFSTLLNRLKTHGEVVTIEAKKGSEVGRSVMETVCAFANESGLGGGYLLLGVVENSDGFHVVGVKNPDKIQNDLITQCGSGKFNIPIRPEIAVETFENKRVVVAFIPEAAAVDKPVYIRELGLPKGAFRRIGASDVHCTDDDISIMFQNRCGKSFEETIFDTVSTTDDFSDDALTAYRLRRKTVSPNAAELGWTDLELLRSLRAVVESGGTFQVTACGLFSFGKEAALRREVPMTRVDYIRINGRHWVPTSEVRFQTVEMRGPLLTLIPRVISTIMADIPVSAVFEAGSIYRKDVPLIPEQVIREAVVNALMHRNYRTQEPIQIIRYNNRIEIRNPGCSLKSEVELELGTSGSITRNGKIATILHECNLAETKGSGIQIMRKRMEESGLEPPLFHSDRASDHFVVTVSTEHFPEEKFSETTPQVTPQATPQVSNEICRLVNAIDGEMTRSEIQKRLNLTDREHFRKVYLNPSILAGLVEQTDPDKPRSSKQKYRLTEMGCAYWEQGSES